MEEINSLDDMTWFHTVAGTMNDEKFSAPSGETGIMKSVLDSYPDNIGTCSRLVIEQSCSSEAAYHILCTREHIRHITVDGRTYSRQEIACMESGKRLGGVGGIEAPWDVPFDAPAPPRRAIFTAAELGEPDRNPVIPQAVESPQTTVGVYEQLQQAVGNVAGTPLNLDEMFQIQGNILRERQARQNEPVNPMTQPPAETLYAAPAEQPSRPGLGHFTQPREVQQGPADGGYFTTERVAYLMDAAYVREMERLMRENPNYAEMRPYYQDQHGVGNTAAAPTTFDMARVQANAAVPSVGYWVMDSINNIDGYTADDGGGSDLDIDPGF